MNEDYLKSLKQQQKDFKKNLQKLKTDRDLYQETIKKINKEIDKVEKELQRINNLVEGLETGSCITDHALVRYLERNGIINIEEMKQKLLTDAVVLGLLNEANVVSINGTDFVVKNGKVVTTYNKE